jgi:hypothetical protein
MNTATLTFRESVWCVWTTRHYPGGYNCGGGCFTDFWAALEYLRTKTK